ncbi:ATP-binding cassette domain-containing protein [Streptomyces fulvorobeus]|uniref:ABC transporter ATP-binding protein n=1 Tax=Streptomyces fulvorobeus TaxID=284028 RepID=A0A7J0CE96_9ACTN|nr:ABC transporter ATP-binding protein [Streptomyces fulvorobeus]NYE44302.1 ABC-type multidrug transport system ATPase subunit [Streptomyces fulvorobeus]GFN00820.1 ABC transporter ATP-binding protein [Streptomyces fulvorobeus]
MPRLEAVSKRYGRGRWILQDVDVEIPAGSVVAFAGGNGSGKSTLLRMVVGLSKPTRGAVTGRPAVVSYVPDRFSPNERMSPLAYLTHMGRIRGMGTHAASSRAHHLLDRLALVGGKDAELRTLSKGNAQKVALAQAVLVQPQLLVLDEPWSGLDASAHGVLAEIMTEVSGAGGAVAFTDHRESVTRAHASQTYTVKQGRVTLRGPEAVVQRYAVTAVALGMPGHGGVPQEVEWGTIAGVLSVAARGPGALLVEVEQDHADALLLVALRTGWSVVDVTRAARSHRVQDSVAGGNAR